MERTEITKHGVTLRISNAPADESRVGSLESALGCRLPDDYREFLLCHNGGRPRPATFQFALRKGPGTDSSVAWFLALYDGEYSNLEQNRKDYERRVPPETLPIATDPFGNVVLLGIRDKVGLLGIRGKVRGQIYFWDHEEEPASQPNWSNVDLIADSFDGFMRGLRAP